MLVHLGITYSLQGTCLIHRAVLGYNFGTYTNFVGEVFRYTLVCSVYVYIYHSHLSKSEPFWKFGVAANLTDTLVHSEWTIRSFAITLIAICIAICNTTSPSATQQVFHSSSNPPTNYNFFSRDVQLQLQFTAPSFGYDCS